MFWLVGGFWSPGLWCLQRDVQQTFQRVCASISELAGSKVFASVLRTWTQTTNPAPGFHFRQKRDENPVMMRQRRFRELSLARNLDVKIRKAWALRLKEQTAKLLGRESPKLDLYQPLATCPFHPGRDAICVSLPLSVSVSSWHQDLKLKKVN